MPVTELIELLRTPEQAADFDPEQWVAVLEQGQQQLLLGQLASLVQDRVKPGGLPEAVRRHFDLALLTANRRVEVALWEIGLIRSIIPSTIPVILLKGVAYAAAKDSNSTGRLFTDLDLLVPHESLDEVESGLFSNGWLSGPVDEYDQKYYREWMHELPPMKHVRRQSVIDLHHAIVPVISRYSFSTERLFQAAVEVAPNLFVLSPTDRIIHCAIHAVIEGDAGKLLRELYDLSALIRQHAGQPSDTAHIFERARELGVEELVVPPMQAADHVFGSAARMPDERIAGWLVSAATNGQDDRGVSVSIARLGLLAHSHRIKMPIGMLIPHLIRKTVKLKAPPAGD